LKAFFPDLSPGLAALADQLCGERTVVLGHAKPDGDCVGAQIALARLLQARGVEAVPCNADPPPSSLAFLQAETRVRTLDAEAARSLPAIYADCADPERVGGEASRALAGIRPFANVDHHISNTRFAERNLVDTTASATCEIVAGMALDLGWEIDAPAANALYAGVLTDTGRFGYASTSPRVFEICARLVEAGAAPAEATTALYATYSIPQLKLLERFLRSLELACGGRVCVGQLRQADFEATGANPEDTEGFVDYARAAREADIGVLLEERKSTVKGSLRAADGSWRLDQVARRFGGGGHAAAAGLSSDLPLDDLRAQLLQALEERLSAAPA